LPKLAQQKGKSGWSIQHKLKVTHTYWCANMQSAALQESVDVQVDVQEPLLRRSDSDGPAGEDYCEEDAIAR
jgi:hypothetical protein